MSAAVGAGIAIRRLDAPIGAEITGVDLSRPLDDATFEQIRKAYSEHSVIVFRGQQLTPAQQIAFSRRFGELEIHVLKQFLLPGHPEILVVSNILEDGKPIGLADAGRVAVWHTDLSYMKAPSAGSRSTRSRFRATRRARSSETHCSPARSWRTTRSPRK
jgi:taurine dioxygenase